MKSGKRKQCSRRGAPPCRRIYPERANPASARRSPICVRILGVVGFAGVALVLQGCSTTRPVEPLTVYEEPKAANAGGGETISVGTYNLGGLTDPGGLALTLEALTNVDVWAVQEVLKVGEAESCPIIPLRECMPPKQLRNLFPVEWNLYFVPVNRVGEYAWEGQAIASRYPLRNQCVWELRRKGNKRRVALACEVVTPKANLLVVNTDHEVAIPSIHATDRQLQVEDLVKHIRLVASTNSLVLLGDFNTCGKPLQFCRRTSTKEIRELRRSLSAASLEPLPESEVPYKTFHTALFSRALDHIFLRNARCCRWGSARNSRGSDHQPLWTTIRTN